MNAGINGANGMNIGAMGYIPAGQAGRGGFTNQPPHAGGMGGGIPMMGKGAVGVNGLGGPTKNAGFGGANDMNIGAVKYQQAGQASLGDL